MADRSSEADTAELFAELRRTGDRAIRNRLVEDHRGLAGFFARRYRNRGVSTDDLRQVAMVGLIKAVDRFDPERGFQFSTFAGRTIEGELKRYFRDKTWTVRVPRRTKELGINVRRAIAELTQRLERSPTIIEVAQHLDLELEEVVEALDAGSSAYRPDPIDVASSDEDRPSDREAALGEIDRDFAGVENRMLVDRLLATLPERERRIVELRFYDRMSQSEIADRVGISQMHVSRLLRKTLTQMRESLVETS